MRIKRDSLLRAEFVRAAYTKVQNIGGAIGRMLREDEEESSGVGLFEVTRLTVDAFFGNNLFNATKLFMRDAVGNFPNTAFALDGCKSDSRCFHSYKV